MAELPQLASSRGMLFIASLGLMVASIGPALPALGAWRQSISHDHLFHSVLGLLGMKSRRHDPVLDLSAACRSG